MDLAAGAVLFAVDLAMLLPGQPSAIGLAIGVDLLIDALFTILHARGLPGIHRPVANPVGDAILLVLAALADFVVAIVRHVGVVLVLIDRVTHMILLAIDLLPLLLSQMAVVGLAIVADLAIQVGLARLQIPGLARGQLP